MSGKFFNNTNTLRIGIKRSDIVSPPEPVNLGDTAVRLQAMYVTEGSELFEELLNNVYDAVLITRLDGRIVKTNSRAQEHFQYTGPDFRRLNILDLVSGASDDVLFTVREYLKGQQHVFIEAYAVRKDGAFFPCEMTGNMLHLDEEEHLCFFIRNVTVRKETEDALRHAQEELVKAAHSAGMAEIATGVLHDVGNILNSVTVSADLILGKLRRSALDQLQEVNAFVRKRSKADPAFMTTDPTAAKLPSLYMKLAEKLTSEQGGIREEMINLSEKINVIRDVVSTQQDYAKAGLFVEDVKLQKVVDDALALQQATMTKLSLKIEKNYGDIEPVPVQKTKLIHVLTNLICNAIDAMREVQDREPILRLNVRAEAGQALIEVEDNGSGISKKNLTKVFNHGFTTKAHGHGFGLHTCANFMTEMGGRIFAESAGSGRGARFSLTFPLPKREEQA